MRENFTSGSVGRAPGNRCLYPEIDILLIPLIGAKNSQFLSTIKFGDKLLNRKNEITDILRILQERRQRYSQTISSVLKFAATL